MPFVANPTTAMVELFYTQDSQRLENTLYFDLSVTPTPALLTTLVADIQAWYIANIEALVSNTVTLRGIKATSLASNTAPVIEEGFNIVGDRVDPALPNNVTLAIKFLTAGRGRSARGRNYVVGLTEGQVVGNLVDDTVRASYVAAYEELLAPGTLSDGIWVVYSRFLNNAERAVGLSQVVTGAAFTDSVIDSQRRRLPGRGM